jgi:transposase
MRVVICGGGVVGACTAYFFSRRGAQVIVVESTEVAAAASGKAGGFLALDWCAGTPVDALARRSFQLHAALPKEIADDWGYRPMTAYSGFVVSKSDPRRQKPSELNWLSNGVVISSRLGRYDLTEFEWNVIKPLLPNKARGVPRVDDRRVLNGIFYQLRSGSPWADLPERYGPYTTVYNPLNRWRKAGVWNRLMDAIIAAYEAKGQKLQMIDSTSVRVHQQAAAQKNRMEFVVSVVRGKD